MILVSIPVGSLCIEFESRLTKFMSCHTFLYRCGNFVINELCVFPSSNIIDAEVDDEIKPPEFNFTLSCLSSIKKCEHQLRNLYLWSGLLYLDLFVKHEEGEFLVFSLAETC